MELGLKFYALMRLVWRRVLFWPFRAASRYEVDNILNQILRLDEYRMRGCRFAPDDVIIDIGAHIGAFSHLCYTRGSRAIYCYEPGNRNFRLLERHLGSRPGVHLIRKAVWRSDSSQPPELLLSGPLGENTGSNSVLAGGRVVDFSAQKLLRPEGQSPVPAIPLDEILQEFDRVKLLKIDCEGSEFPVLLTSRQLHKVERLVGEVHEMSEECVALLSPESRVEGYSAYRLLDLVEFLECSGFQVQAWPGQDHFSWISARRTL
jgi:FkbM family methyltransferase